MRYFELVHSINEQIAPVPWIASPVVPVIWNGDVLGYASLTKITTEAYVSAVETGDCAHILEWKLEHTRTSIPVEFFNHELKELDCSNDRDVVAFSSNFGLLGFNDAFSKTALAAVAHPDSDKDHESFMHEYISKANLYEMTPAQQERRCLDYLEHLSDALHKLTEKLGGEFGIWHFAADESLRGERKLLLEYASIVKASAICESKSEFADFINSPIDEVDFTCYQTLKSINRYFLSDISPRVGYTRNGGEPVYPGGNTYEGSLGCAIALQIKQFAIDLKDGYFICSGCGEVFKHKQSNSKTSRKPRKNAKNVFCCQKCANRISSSNHRQTPGYKRKQEEKRASKESSNKTKQ